MAGRGDGVLISERAPRRLYPPAPAGRDTGFAVVSSTGRESFNTVESDDAMSMKAAISLPINGTGPAKSRRTGNCPPHNHSAIKKEKGFYRVGDPWLPVEDSMIVE